MQVCGQRNVIIVISFFSRMNTTSSCSSQQASAQPTTSPRQDHDSPSNVAQPTRSSSRDYDSASNEHQPTRSPSRYFDNSNVAQYDRDLPSIDRDDEYRNDRSYVSTTKRPRHPTPSQNDATSRPGHGSSSTVSPHNSSHKKKSTPNNDSSHKQKAPHDNRNGHKVLSSFSHQENTKDIHPGQRLLSSATLDGMQTSSGSHKVVSGKMTGKFTGRGKGKGRRKGKVVG